MIDADLHEQLLWRESEHSVAAFSPCEKYRYYLVRSIDGERPFIGGRFVRGPSLVCIMCNPSTADEMKMDPTVTRVFGYARDWGFKSMVILNVMGYRATKPKDLLTVDDPVGPHNAQVIAQTLSQLYNKKLICAWGVASGQPGKLVKKYSDALWPMLKEHKPHYIKLTKAGYPRHPLYLAANLKPQPYDHPDG